MAKKEDKQSEKEEPKKKGGCLRTVLMLALLLLGVLGIFAYLTFDPQDLSDIEGYRETPSLLPPSGRDLLKVLDAAQQYGCERLVLLGVRLAVDLLQVETPDWVRREVFSRADVGAAGRFNRRAGECAGAGIARTAAGMD